MGILVSVYLFSHVHTKNSETSSSIEASDQTNTDTQNEEDTDESFVTKVTFLLPLLEFPSK